MASCMERLLFGPRLLPGGTVLNQDDLMDLMPGFAAPLPGPNYPNANNLHAVSLRGTLDADRLRKAIDALQARHPRTRARYHEDFRTNYLLETDERIPLEIRDGRFGDINSDLERALAKPIDTLRGPFCHFTYVRHAEEGTGLLIFAQTHGVGDGRACEVMMAQLLKLYNGDDVPFYRNARSFWQMAPARARPEKLEAWHDIEERMPHRDDRSIVGTFVDPQHPTFEASFAGCCIELVRFTPEEAAALLQVSRRNKVTLTGTFAAAVHYAILTELSARGRASEFISLGMDMNMRGRAVGPEFDDECGNFVVDTHVHCALAPDFFETARLVSGVLKQVVDKDCGFEANLFGFGSLYTRDALQLLRRANLDQWVSFTGVMEHANVSSLGVLKRFGKYKDFEVLENLSMAHASFLGCKANCCTSGSSGNFTACIMVTRNVVPDARSLACKLRDHIDGILRGLMADEGTPAHQAVLQRCASAAETMQLAVEAVKEKVELAPKTQSGLPLLGDTSRQIDFGLRLKVVVNVVCSTIAVGCLSGFPLYELQLKEAGVFSYYCEPGVRTCSGQDAALAHLYQNSQFLSFFVSIFIGCIFDRLGAQRSAVIGAVCTSLSLSVISVFIALDAQAWPWTQFCVLYLCFAVSDACGLLSSFGVAGWLWHFPRHQSLIIGLLNGSYQGSSIVGLLFAFLSRRGWGLSSGFLVVACANLVAAGGFYLTTPTHEEYLAEASRVLRVSPKTVDVSTIAGWRVIKLELRALWGCLKIFPLENCLFYAAGVVATMGLFTWLSVCTTTYERWFGELGAAGLTSFFAFFFSPLGLVLNPLSGLVLDRVSLPAYILTLSSVMLGLAMLVAWRDETAQQWFVVLISFYMGTMQNAQSKWSLVFVPPDLFGASNSSFMMAAGFGAAFFTWTSPRITALVMLATFVLQVSCAGVLLRRGLPKRPPKNEYDSRRKLMSR